MSAAISSFCFFASGAIIPVLPYLFGLEGWAAIAVAAVLVGIALLGTGAVVGVLSGGRAAPAGAPAARDRVRCRRGHVRARPAVRDGERLPTGAHDPLTVRGLAGCLTGGELPGAGAAAGRGADDDQRDPGEDHEDGQRQAGATSTTTPPRIDSTPLTTDGIREDPGCPTNAPTSDAIPSTTKPTPASTA